MKRKRLKICVSMILAVILVFQSVTWNEIRVAEREVFADSDGVITEEYDGFTCTIINEKDVIISGEGSLWTQCNAMLNKRTSDGESYSDITFKSITFGEGITEISRYCRFYNADVINIPASCTTIDSIFLRYMYNVKKINIAADNPEYIAEDNIIYSKDKKELIRSAVRENSKYTIPDYVEEIAPFAFNGSNINEIDFTENGRIREIGSQAFAGCSVSTVYIPKYIETVKGGNFGNDTKVVIEEDSQLTEYTAESSTSYQISDINFLKPAKHLKRLDLGYTTLSDDDMEILDELKELEILELYSSNLSQEYANRNFKYETTLSLGEQLAVPRSYDYKISDDYGNLPIYSSYISFPVAIENSGYLNDKKIAVKGGKLDTSAKTDIPVQGGIASVPLRINFMDWDTDRELEETEKMNANFMSDRELYYANGTYDSGSAGWKILDSNNNLWEITDDEGEVKIKKKAKAVDEYIAEDVYMYKPDEGGSRKNNDSKMIMTKYETLKCDNVEVSEDVIKYDKNYALTEGGELKNMEGKVVLDNIEDFAGCYKEKGKQQYGNIQGEQLLEYLVLDKDGNLYLVEYEKESETEKVDSNVAKIQQGTCISLFDTSNKYDGDAWAYYLKNDGSLYSCRVNAVRDIKEYRWSWTMEYVNVAEDISDILDFNVFKKNDQTVWYIGYDDASGIFINKQIFSDTYKINSTCSSKLKYIYSGNVGNISDYIFEDDEGNMYQLDEEHNVVKYEGTIEQNTASRQIKENIQKELKYNIYKKNYNSYYGYYYHSVYNVNNIKLENGILYSNNVEIMTNVADAILLYGKEYTGYIVFIRTDGTVWTLNYNEHEENAVPIRIYSLYEEETIIGDANGDGDLNIKDSAMLKRYLAGWEMDIDLLAVDIDGDGLVTVKDSALVKRYLAGWEVKFISTSVNYIYNKQLNAGSDEIVHEIKTSEIDDSLDDDSGLYYETVEKKYYLDGNEETSGYYVDYETTSNNTPITGDKPDMIIIFILMMCINGIIIILAKDKKINSK